MATLHQYFETDFSHTIKVGFKIDIPGNGDFDAVLLHDFAGNMSFLACYIPDEGRPLEFFIRLVQRLQYNQPCGKFDNHIYLPSVRFFHGTLKIDDTQGLTISARLFGDIDWISARDIPCSRRLIIYSATQLSEDELRILKTEAKKNDHEIQFRSKSYVAERTRFEKPLAFICHDSRDKNEVASKIAINLGQMMCPVWYDEYSLKVGDNLRNKIDDGIKTCKKMIIILSKNFFSNSGWTKKEFDSGYIREIMDGDDIFLPIWFDVTREEVYEYSPNLLIKKGLDWNRLGEDEVCRQLHRVLMAEQK